LTDIATASMTDTLYRLAQIAHRTVTCRLDYQVTLVVSFSAGRCPRRRNLRMGPVAAWAICALMAPLDARAQEALMSTTVASLGSGIATSRINLDELNPKPATHRGLAVPSLSVLDDGSGPRVRSLMLQMPDLDLGGFSVASRLGDQRLPAVFRAGALAGPALASPERGLTLSTTGSAPLSLSFGEPPAPAAGKPPTSPAFAAAAVSFTPSSRLSVTPQVLIPSGSPGAQTSVGTGIRANVVGNLAMMTDVGMAGTAETPWVPLASARLVSQWPRAGIETIVLRGAAAPRTAENTALVSSRDREAAQAQVQPLPGLTLAALTSVSRPSSDRIGDDTTLRSLRIAYDGLRSGQVAAVQQREATASRESDITSFEWRQRWLGRMTVRYVHQSASDSALAEANKSSSRVEVGFPVLARRSAGCLDVHAALRAGSISPTDSGVSSRVSGRVALIDDAALTGETELGLTGRDGQVLRGLRVMTEMPVVATTRLQLSYAYRTSPEFPLGQVFEASILRRVSLGW
jgi:hypothetical protein